MPNAGTHAIVIVGVVAEPPSLTVPLASTALGSSGDVAVAVPIVQPVPPVRHRMSAPTVDPECHRAGARCLVCRFVRGLGDRERQRRTACPWRPSSPRHSDSGRTAGRAAGGGERCARRSRRRSVCVVRALIVTFVGRARQLARQPGGWPFRVVKFTVPADVSAAGRFGNVVVRFSPPGASRISRDPGGLAGQCRRRVVDELDPGGVARPLGHDEIQVARDGDRRPPAVTVAVPTWQAAVGWLASRQAPPLVFALPSIPGARANVTSS